MLIFLTGMMGSGKSTVGKQLAHTLRAQFIDMDQRIESEQNRTINEIFESSGEEEFRNLETALLKKLQSSDSDFHQTIVSTGGGVVLREENRKIMATSGIVIYIRADLEDLLKRLSQDKSRPLLKGQNLRKKLTDLYDLRHELYEECTFEVFNKNLDQTVNQILDQI